MLRKITLVAVAAISMGAAALAPSPAAAWGGHGWHGGWHGGWGGPRFYAGGPLTPTDMAAATFAAWSRPRGAPGGAL